MYIYHALINALSAHMIHINLNMIFSTHVEHSPTKTIYIKYYLKKKKNALQTHTHARTHARTHAHTHTHTYCSRNWVHILVRMEILWEEEGFQFGFKRWQGWALSVIVQELCESRGGRPGLSVLTSLLVSVDVKIYWTVLRHWSQLVPNMSPDIWGH